jgi:uncharacterized protein (TIGR02145 family)
MKAIITIGALCMILNVNLNAQDLLIHKTDGTVLSFPLNAIDSLTFFYKVEGFLCGFSTVEDIDGNIYTTVAMGDQCWLGENLRTTHYNNGDLIEIPGSDNAAWMEDTIGAMSWYGNDESWKPIYGALYNYHAAVNTNGICPEGWHVPSDSEWIMLVDYVVEQGHANGIGNANGAGNAIKSCRKDGTPFGGDCNSEDHPRWNPDVKHHGFDAFGFAGYAPGYRAYFGPFLTMGMRGYHWTTTQIGESSAKAWVLVYNNGAINPETGNKNNGYPIRCLKD